MVEHLIFFLGAAVAAIVGLFVVLECGLRSYTFLAERFFYDPVRRADYLDPEYHPYLNVWEDWTKPMFVYHPIGLRLFNTEISIPGRVTNNRLGFRCDEFTPPDPDEMRIVLLGGSAAWGSGATSNQATIASQLERYINEDPSLLDGRKRAKCFNLAQLNGYQTQDVLTLAFFADAIQPDVIVSYTGWNELVASYPMTSELLEKYGVFYVNEMVGWEPVQVSGNRFRMLKGAIVEWTGEKSLFLRKMFSGLARQEPAFDFTVEEIQDRISLCSKLFVKHLKTINACSRSLGARHYQFLQPNLYWKQPLTAEEARIISLYDDVRPVHGGKVIGDYLREHTIYDDVLRAVSVAGNDLGPVIDLSDVFQHESRKIFYTLVHMTDEGQRQIAERMHSALAAKYRPQ